MITNVLDVFGTEFWIETDVEIEPDDDFYLVDTDDTAYIYRGVDRIGVLHREDGPATYFGEWNEATWFFRGREIKCNNQEEFEQIMRFRAFL